MPAAEAFHILSSTDAIPTQETAMDAFISHTVLLPLAGACKETPVLPASCASKARVLTDSNVTGVRVLADDGSAPSTTATEFQVFAESVNAASTNVEVRVASDSSTTPAEVHVLAVDDSVLDRKVIEKLLKTSSYKVTTVDSGNKALEFLGVGGDQNSMQINISLIITDYCMPGMTGYDLLKRVKGTSALKEIPVVIMSSENIPNRIQRCLEEGAKEFIMKPVRMSDVERIKAHIRPAASTYEHTGLSCSKRKFDGEGFQVNNAERRVRFSGLTVA